MMAWPARVALWLLLTPHAADGLVMRAPLFQKASSKAVGIKRSHCRLCSEALGSVRQHSPADGQDAPAEVDDWPLLKRCRQAIKDYGLVQPGDKIAVAVSGGKDSSVLAYLLKQIKARRLLPFDDWDFVTVHLDQVQPGHDPSSLEAWLASEDIPFHLLREDTYSVVTEKTKAGQSYCSLCSRLRRGILYSAAEELGCNRLALGHHRDDALETLLLNMCHQGQTKALPARYVARRDEASLRAELQPRLGGA